MFGEAYAPYLTLRCIQQLVKDEGHKFPLASISLSFRIYIDDIFEEAANETTALDVKKEIIELLSLGGFPLAKWASNCSSLAENSKIFAYKRIGFCWYFGCNLVVTLRFFYS